MRPARAAEQNRRRAGERSAGGQAGCTAGSRCQGDRPRCLDPGGTQRGRDKHPERGQVRVRPRQLCQPPAPAVWGEWVSGWLVVYERFISPRPVGPQFCPDPSPRPLPASCGLVALGPREGSFGRECSPGSPRLLRPRTRQCTPSRPPRAPPPPRPLRRTAGCLSTPGRDAGRRELGVPRAGVPRIASLFCKPKGRLPLTPP